MKFPKGSNVQCSKVLTYRIHSGEFQEINVKIDDLMKKLFLEAIDLLLHIYCCFLQKEQIFKSSKRECSLDVYGTQL